MAIEMTNMNKMPFSGDIVSICTRHDADRWYTRTQRTATRHD